MLKTQEIDIRALLDMLEQPLIEVGEVGEVGAAGEAANETDPAESFDGVCTQHEGCRSIR